MKSLRRCVFILLVAGGIAALALNELIYHMFYQTERNIYDEIQVLDDELEDEANYGVPKIFHDVGRTNLLIVAPDRTGSTFVTTAIDQDPNIFTMYEPLWVTTDWMKRKLYQDHVKAVTEVITAFTNCSFHTTEMGRQFCKDITSFRRVRHTSTAFNSSYICTLLQNGQRNRSLIDPLLADERCRTKTHTAVKVSYARTPNNSLSTYVPLLARFKYLRILHLTRDPRGIINSERMIDWTPDVGSEEFDVHCMKRCQEIEENIRVGMSLLEEFKPRYKLMNYEEIANDPIGSMRRIYDFAGFGEVPEKSIEWINTTTHPTEKQLERSLKRPLSVVRKAQGNAEKWRKTSPYEQLESIQRNCKSLMNFMGYEKVELENALISSS